jgi:hypothetical protein
MRIFGFEWGQEMEVIIFANMKSRAPQGNTHGACYEIATTKADDGLFNHRDAEDDESSDCGNTELEGDRVEICGLALGW